MSSECEQYELRIGMRQHGALDASEESELLARLAGCNSCRSFAANSGSIDEALRQQAAADLAEVDSEKLQHRIRRMYRAYRLKLWLAPLFLLQIPVMYLLATGHLPALHILLQAPGTVAVFLAYVWLVNRPFREVLVIPEGTVWSRLHLARKRLAVLLS